MDCVFAVLVPVVCGSLPDIYVEKLLGFVAACLEKSGHLQFYMTWAQSLLLLHGQKLKNRSAPSLFYCVMKHSLPSQCNCGYVYAACRSGAILPTLQALQKSIQRHFDSLSKL